MRVKKRDLKKILPNKKVYMKKFLEIYLGFFIALPLVFCIVAYLIVYLIGCFATWSIIEVHIDWFFIRAYMIMALVVSFFMSIDE